MIDYSNNPHGDIVFDLVARSSLVQMRISRSEFTRITHETVTEAEFRAEVIKQAKLERVVVRLERIEDMREFIKEAIEAGFSEGQAEFLAEYLYDGFDETEEDEEEEE